MASEFYAQAVPEPCHVLGLRLLPLSLGHVILLQRIDSAFVTDAQRDTNAWEELAIAVAICSQPYREALAMLEDRQGTAKAMALWAQKLTRTTWRDRLLRRKAVTIDLHGQWQAFSDYLKANTKVPHYSYNPDDMREVSCPHVQLVKCSLQRSFGFSDETMLDRSWSQCLWDYVTLKALDGQVQMTDRDVIKEAQEAAERLAAKLAERKANGAS